LPLQGLEQARTRPQDRSVGVHDGHGELRGLILGTNRGNEGRSHG
jgi:hypothetical protein